MDALTTTGEDILFITDEQGPPLVARRRLRAFCWLGFAGVFALMAWVTAMAVDSAVRESRLRTCASQIRQLGLAMLAYNEAHGQFPAPALAGRDGTKLLSWRVAILPYLGYQSLYERFHLDEPWDSPHNRSLLAEMPTELACPSGPRQREGRTAYLIVVGPEMDTYSINTPFEPTRGADIRHITDGTSSTVIVLETDTLVPWTKPDDLTWTKGEPLPRLASPHTGGSHVVFADGASRFIKSTINPNTFQAILTINGGEVLSGPG